MNTALKLPYPDPVEIYSTSEELFEALDIPASAQGRVSDDRDGCPVERGDAERGPGRRRGTRERAGSVAGPEAVAQPRSSRGRGPEAATAKRRAPGSDAVGQRRSRGRRLARPEPSPTRKLSQVRWRQAGQRA